jgi:hypothetical protein
VILRRVRTSPSFLRHYDEAPTLRGKIANKVKDLRRKAQKKCCADLMLENRLLKKSMIAVGGDDE